jgi:mannose-1-phosphate guanylyltransferase
VKAFLLSAGLGTRLKPLTDDVPKCLVEVNGKPLLYIWLDLLERDGVDEVLINTHYFADKVEEAVRKRDNKIKVKLYYEKVLHGSGGTILANEDFVRNEKEFFFIFADNLSNVSLMKIWDFHVKNDSLFTTYVYRTDVPKQKGIFVADENGKVLDFEEKPEFPKSDLASAGIGVLSNEVFEIFEKMKRKDVHELRELDELNKLEMRKDFTTEKREFSGKEQKDKGSNDVIDFGKDVMPMLLGNMYVMETSDYIRDIGTMKDLEEAREEFSQL